MRAKNKEQVIKKIPQKLTPSCYLLVLYVLAKQMMKQTSQQANRLTIH